VTVVVVTGSGTGVGKTVLTAALAALAVEQGCRVAVLKPAQTGVGPNEPGDVDEIRRLTGDVDSRVTAVELVRYREALAPATAARRAGSPGVTTATVVRMARQLAGQHELVLVEGAGGLLVRLSDDPPATVADVATEFAAPVLVVAAAGLGTLNHTALTIEALHARGLRDLGMVIGRWPAQPSLAARCNVADLPAVTGVPLIGALPTGMARLAPQDFLAAAREALPADLIAQLIGHHVGGPGLEGHCVDRHLSG
jgi:dethiobiotin synthetase